MAEAPRPRPVEYYNPRPLILGACFFWGIAIGFCLFYFAPPERMMGSGQTSDGQTTVLPAAAMSELERRHLDTPDIADVVPAPETAPESRLSLDTLVLQAPAPILTRDGGITGRTTRIPSSVARPRTAGQPSTLRPAPNSRPQPLPAPPPIPELMP